MTIGKLIKKKRIEKKISQMALGKFFNYTNGQFVSNWERGASFPPHHIVRMLCTILDIDLEKYKKMMVSDFKRKIEEEI